MKNVFFLGAIIIMLSSCGGKSSNAIEGNVSLNDDGNGDQVISQPDSVIATFDLDHENLSSNEISNLTLPYEENLFPTISANDSINHAKCHQDHLDSCIVNRQVLFKFDLTSLKNTYPSHLWAIREVTLQATLTTPFDNDPKEKICFLNTGKCSGEVIIPVLDDLDDQLFDFIANEDFWSGGINSVMLSQTFTNFVTDNFENATNTWRSVNVSLPISSLLNFSEQTFTLIQNQYDELIFLVTDDVHVKDPKIQVILREI